MGTPTHTHAPDLHDVLGRVGVGGDDVLEAKERRIGFHDLVHLLPCVGQGQAVDVDLALGKTYVELGVFLEGHFELREDVQAFGK